MSIATSCPSCNRRINAPDHVLGKNVRCPQCKNPFTVQALTEPSAVQPAPAPSPAASPPEDASDEKPVRSFPVKKALIAAGLLFVACGVVYSGWWVLSALFGPGVTEFASKEGGFTVLMPGTPDPKDASDSKLPGVSIHEFTVAPSSSTTYSVHYYDMKYKPINDYLYISWLKNNLLGSTPQSKLARDNPLTLKKHTGREFVLDLPDEQVLTRRVILANHRVFWLTAQHPKAETAAAQQFLNSFAITKTPPAAKEFPSVIAMGPSAPVPPPTKKDPPVTKPPVKKDPTPPPSFAMSPDEKSMVGLINNYRTGRSAKPLTPQARLFKAARREALTIQSGKQTGDNYGYGSIYRITVPGVKITPNDVFASLLRSKISQLQMVEATFVDIGVGVRTNKRTGTTYYVILLCGNPR